MAEPGWVAENKLAESLGWWPERDTRRDDNHGTYWCKFKKFDMVVWSAYPRWVRARFDGNAYVEHKYYGELEHALTGEGPELPGRVVSNAGAR